MERIPVTVVTGYLGSGKTTIILNLIKQLDPNYKVVWLKNEFGDVSVDSELAKENNIQVTEMLNGCLCCVLVGRLKDALEEILRKYTPDRIVIESSGTAFPMPIVFEINRLEQLRLDGVVNVIDALNFNGYHDKGYVAKMQSGYTDLIIINKTGLATPEQVEQVLDEVYELNPSTPKLQTQTGNVPAALMLGLDTKLEAELANYQPETEHHDVHDHPDDVETFGYFTPKMVVKVELEKFLDALRRDFIRIKGVVQTAPGKFELMNWVYGRITWDPLSSYTGESKVVFMGKDINGYKQKVLGELEKLAS